jgi:hypothetical protein
MLASPLGYKRKLLVARRRGPFAAEGATPIPPGISCPATREQAPAEVRGGRGRACAMPRLRSPSDTNAESS